jgi:putative redox protein
MAEAKVKTTVTMKLEGSCPSHSRSDVSVRDVELVIDEPTERGGTNLGPSPTETMMAALIGCTNVISNKIAEGMGVKFHRVDISAAAAFDRRGVTLQAEVDVPFPEITLDINVTTDANQDQIKEIQTELAKFCPIAKVIRGGGSVINENWTITAP